MNIRLQTLPPLKVAYAHFIGSNPEYTVWKQLLSWVKENSLLTPDTQFYGFNTPNTHDPKEERGYEAWMLIDGDIPVSGTIQTKEYEKGGLYAVHHITLSGIEKGWGDFITWLEGSEYQYDDSRQYFEAHFIDEKMMNRLLEEGQFDEAELQMDLYLPIKK